MLLEKIQKENDIKQLKPEELEKLAEEIRQFLVEKISVTGGHLASNLGVVELTMALHLAFELPQDKMIWDVGHQSYTHKILTGRRAGFDDLRKYGGMSGFPKRKESECDAFDTGHSSTSISAGLGYVAARDIKGEEHSVISIIGDGAMTGGMAHEALNNILAAKGYTTADGMDADGNKDLAVSYKEDSLDTTTYAMSKLADKAACIVLGLPDCTEPAVPEHENAPAHSGVFLTALPDDPMFVDITEQNGTFYMQREWCRTELVKEEDGGYRIGSLDEKIYFTDNGILYRLPGRVLTLTPAKPADPALFQEGTYYNDETDSFMKLVKVENTCEIHMRRYGKTTLYQSGSGSIIFRMDANLVMYVKAENDTIIMDGGRVKHIIYQKQ